MRLVKALIFSLLLSVVIIGQTNKGNISGTVTDAKGSVIPGATVTVTNIGTNQSVTLTTSSELALKLPSLEVVNVTD